MENDMAPVASAVPSPIITEALDRIQAALSRIEIGPPHQARKL
jgi:hypothetical protein